MKPLWIGMLLILLAGCAPEQPQSQAELFRKKHPDIARGYLVLAPVSVEYIEHIRPDEQLHLDGVIKNIEKAKGDPTHIDRYLDHLQRLRDGRKTERADWVSLTNRIKSTDSMYYFEYKIRIVGERYDDHGLLILRNGEIIYRSIFGQGFSGGLTEQDVPRATIDDL
jgi:hypothetical protein